MPLDVPRPPAVPEAGGSLRLTAMSIEAAAAVFRKAGSRHVDADAIRADLAVGAPANPDGTINLLAYAAWMLTRIASKEGGHG